MSKMPDDEIIRAHEFESVEGNGSGLILYTGNIMECLRKSAGSRTVGRDLNHGNPENKARFLTATFGAVILKPQETKSGA
jgi:hypothetical protein